MKNWESYFPMKGFENFYFTCNIVENATLIYMQFKDSKMFYYVMRLWHHTRNESQGYSGAYIPIICFFGEPIIHQLEILIYWLFETWMCLEQDPFEMMDNI